MGFLHSGTTLDWENVKEHIAYLKEHGVIQFLILYFSNADRKDDFLLWGDEIEYIIINRDRIKKNYRLSLNAYKLIEKLNIKGKHEGASWRDEYGSYMLEGSPHSPFGKQWSDLVQLEVSMNKRRQLIQSLLSEDEFYLTIPNFPQLGCADSTFPSAPPGGLLSCSTYTSDLVINPHNRFGTLTKNIRIRRGSKVSINVPIFMDKNTIYPTYDEERSRGIDAKDGCIYMDSMVFGMGMCCLQCTYQFLDLEQARNVNDQFVVLAPIMLAMTAGTPIFRGFLADTDTRWPIISASVDDRTPYERGETSLNEYNNKYVIGKSRYDSIDSYIGQNKYFKPEYNDLEIVCDEELYKTLREKGVDHLMAQHISHLFIRDPLVVYKGCIELDDELFSDHFESIQSTNWQTVRFKPPSADIPAGWRVEFRPMEVQLTDFENAAFVIFITILTRYLLRDNLNLYLPISKVDENLKRAHLNNSVVSQKFYWRKSILEDQSATDSELSDEYEELSINTIMNHEKQGLIPLVSRFLDGIDLEPDSRSRIDMYLEFLSKKASGELLTYAQWQRNFVMNSKFYNRDSVVTPKITREMINTLIGIESGAIKDRLLLGDFNNLVGQRV